MISQISIHRRADKSLNIVAGGGEGFNCEGAASKSRIKINNISIRNNLSSVDHSDGKGNSRNKKMVLKKKTTKKNYSNLIKGAFPETPKDMVATQKAGESAEINKSYHGKMSRKGVSRVKYISSHSYNVSFIDDKIEDMNILKIYNKDLH